MKFSELISYNYLWITFIVMLGTIFGLYLAENPSFRQYEEGVLDLYFALRGRQAGGNINELAVVLIDEESVKNTYGYYDPLPRHYIAVLIDTLVSKGAKIIALDIGLFDKFDVLDPDGDQQLAKAIKRAGNVFNISVVSTQKDNIFHVQNPHPHFLEGLKGIGHAMFQVSGSGAQATVRRVKPFIKISESEFIPSFATIVYCHYKNIDPDLFMREMIGEEGNISPKLILHNGSMIINYAGPPSILVRRSDQGWFIKKTGVFPTYRSSRITSSVSLPDDLFKGKVIFIGNGSEYSRDQFVTPFYGIVHGHTLMRGAEIHANIFLTLLHEKFINSLSLHLLGIILVVLSTLVCLSTYRIRFILQIIIVLGSIFMTIFLGYFYFLNMGLWIPVFSIVNTLIFVYFCMSVYLGLTEKRLKKQIKTIFQRYVPPEYVNELLKNPRKLELGGEEKLVSILFSDLESFTSLSEKLTPKELVSFLNNYLEAMTQIIFKYGGTIDKYIGDAIVAVFGAPLELNDHALSACYTALEMQQQIKQNHRSWLSDDSQRVHCRIGINSGKVIVGNIGSKIRYDYTCIGDSMNLAARLESANKDYDTAIMISEYVYRSIKDKLVVRNLGKIIVRGKTKPVLVYELLGKNEDSFPDDRVKMLNAYNSGMEFYMQNRYKFAIEKFKEANFHDINDKPTQIYLEKCIRLLDLNPS
jgi:class 3 adenylate cyclase